MVIKRKAASVADEQEMEFEVSPRQRSARKTGTAVKSNRVARQPRKNARVMAPTEDKAIRDESIRDFGKRNMTTYAIAVNLDRSVPDLYDGMKPVQRRILWAASHQTKFRLTKTARVVGDVIGKYHPHGDASVAQAIETMVNMPTPAILGEGNWGTMIDNAAAMRYTNIMLSAYGNSFFDPHYINREVTSFVPNYDDVEIEPVTLPAQLPNVLLNGGEGIGVGITTGLPSFTPESVIEVLERMLKGEKLQAEDFAKTLKFAHKWGGQIVNTKENKKAWLGMFLGSTASVAFESDIEVDRDHKTMTISDWPPGTNLEKFVDKVRAMPETARVYNSKGATTFTVDMKPAYNYIQFDKFLEKVRTATRQKRNFKINVTHRTADVVDGVTTFKTDFLALSVPELLLQWLRLRVKLETKSLEIRISKQSDAIAYTELLIYAADKLDIIFKAIRSADPEAGIVKGLKITVEQAKQILDLKVRQLSKLDQDAMKDRLKAQQAEMKTLQGWLKRPRSKVLLNLEEVKANIEWDRKFEFKKDTQELTIA